MAPRGGLISSKASGVKIPFSSSLASLSGSGQVEVAFRWWRGGGEVVGGHLHPLIYMPNDQAEAAAALAAVVSAGTAGRAFLIVHAMEDTYDIL